MPDSTRRVYWDSCAFLSFMNGVPDRLPATEALLDAASKPDGGVVIFTSTLSMAEVAWATVEQLGRALDPDVQSQIDALWDDRTTVKLVELHPMIAREARDIMREGLPKGWQLKAGDAIHLATARHIGVAEFHTYDDKFKRYETEMGFAVSEPYMPQLRLDL